MPSTFTFIGKQTKKLAFSEHAKRDLFLRKEWAEKTGIEYLWRKRHTYETHVHSKWLFEGTLHSTINGFSEWGAV
jgi:hypothetical protein